MGMRRRIPVNQHSVRCRCDTICQVRNTIFLWPRCSWYLPPQRTDVCLATETSLGPIAAYVIIKKSFDTTNLIFQTLRFDVDCGWRAGDFLAIHSRSGRAPSTISPMRLRSLCRDRHEVRLPNSACEPKICLLVGGNVKLQCVL